MPGKSAKLDLPPEYCAMASIDVHARMQKIVEGSNNVYINMEQVVSIDTAGLQLLLVFKQALDEQRREVTWSNIPDEVVTTANLVGCYELLEIDG